MAVNPIRAAIHVPGCAPVGTRRTLQQLANALPAIDRESGMAFTNPYFNFVNAQQYGDTTSGDTYISTMAALPFELDGDLSGGSAAAYRYEWNGTTYVAAGGTVTVRDPFSLAPWAVSGDIVFCGLGGSRAVPVVLACNRSPILVATLGADWPDSDDPFAGSYTPLGSGLSGADIYHQGFIGTGMQLASGTKIIAAWTRSIVGATETGAFQVISASECEEVP